jgi:hypothetical protein
MVFQLLPFFQNVQKGDPWIDAAIGKPAARDRGVDFPEFDPREGLLHSNSIL